MNGSDSTDFAVNRLAMHSENLSDAVKRLRERWHPESPPPYVAMASVADELVAAKPLDIETIGAVLSDAEQIMNLGGPEAELVAVGFLEALLSKASAGQFEFRDIIGLLGPRSLEYCEAWDKFTGCDTVAEAKK